MIGFEGPESRSGQIMLQVVYTLADGKWHVWEDVVRKVSRTIPLGERLRRNERDRVRLTTKKGLKPRARTKNMNEAARALSGGRTLIKWALQNQRGAVEWSIGGEHLRLLFVPTKLVTFLPPGFKLAPGIGLGRPADCPADPSQRRAS